MESFHASVQYNDLKGSVAADHADKGDASGWLIKNGHMSDNEHLVGISMWAGENHGTHQDPVYVHFLIKEVGSSDDEPVLLKKIDVEMNVVDFFALFKRFEVTLSSNGSFEGKEFTTLE